MSNARIIEIPATRQIRSGKNNTMRKMRVAAYCRVSTEEEEQQGHKRPHWQVENAC